MGVLLVLVLVLLAAFAAVVFSGLVDRYRFARSVDHLKRAGLNCLSKVQGFLERARSSGAFGRKRSGTLSNLDADLDPQSPAPVDIRVLNCRVQLAKQKEQGRIVDAFSMDICGSIHTSIAACRAALKVTILDVTDGSPRPVQSSIKQGTTAGGSTLSPFCHKADLGKLPHQVTILSDWKTVTQLPLDKLLFPRKGGRNLQFDVSVLSAGTGQELAHARCRFAYENPDAGYMDLEDNAERIKVLAVALAFAVSAADGDLQDCEIDVIKRWARDNILDTSAPTCGQDEARLDKALSKTVAFFRAGNRLDSYGICMELLDIAPVAHRYDILELCLYVARASGSVAAEELAILKDLALSLDVDFEKFRVMLEKVLPVEMHQVKDIEAVLGITSDMDREKARRHLNKEYSKWNSRVTNADPGIQNQADQMLKLIAEARSQYTREQPVPQEDVKASKH